MLLRDERDLFRNCALEMLDMLGNGWSRLSTCRQRCHPGALRGGSGDHQVRHSEEEGVEEPHQPLAGQICHHYDRQADLVPAVIEHDHEGRHHHHRQDAQEPALHESLSTLPFTPSSGREYGTAVQSEPQEERPPRLRRDLQDHLEDAAGSELDRAARVLREVRLQLHRAAPQHAPRGRLPDGQREDGGEALHVSERRGARQLAPRDPAGATGAPQRPDHVV